VVVGLTQLLLPSELWPQMREYERGLVAVMNAYIGETMATYFEDLESGLREIGLRAPVLTTKSNGGVMNAREAGQRPVETLLSGPAAGVIGAAFVARAAGFERLITLDMGGTSADVAVVDGDPRYSTENHVGDFPVIMPAIDVSSIGAGGGSIAWTDSHGVLKVGPQSAGASPGPACYGLGGTHPTVTDAYVSLGIIDPARFLGGTLPLDPALARAALDRLAPALGLDIPETAESILRVATAQMYATLVPLMARKGINLDDFALLAFGGAGPTHGFLLAREVGIRRVIVPLHPGVLCATGSLLADVRRDFVRTLELEAPVVVRRYMLAEEVAAGKYRGGAGVVLEFQVMAPNAIVTARGMDRQKFRPWGRKGGHPGALGETVLHPGTPEARSIGKIDVLRLNPGDTVRIVAPGGGGYGDPLERDPELVRTDVANGFVNAERAAEDYGVILDGGNVNLPKTLARRAELARGRARDEFVFGPERTEYERRLPPALQDAVATALLEYPGAVRHFLKEQLYQKLEENGAAALDPAALRERVQALLKEMELPTA
jgi:hypothetical protein